ncbi:Chitin binding protein [Bacillus cereus]|nr:Chitin binding protein [Bacillus cereus]
MEILYYEKGWNPNKPLTRSDLDLVPFYVKNDGGARPGTTVTHEANVPTDRSGYHLILAVWEIADTGNAFYQVIDVNLLNNGLSSNFAFNNVVQAPTLF